MPCLPWPFMERTRIASPSLRSGLRLTSLAMTMLFDRATCPSVLARAQPEAIRPPIVFASHPPKAEARQSPKSLVIKTSLHAPAEEGQAVLCGKLRRYDDIRLPGIDVDGYGKMLVASFSTTAKNHRCKVVFTSFVPRGLLWSRNPNWFSGILVLSRSPLI